MGRTVVIAEKPSVGRDIARVLGCGNKGEGCLTGGDWVVTWAVGHLVTLSEPDEIDPQYKRWSMAALPILPREIPLKVIPASRSQFEIVRRLINAPETERLVCATDAGREGELIFRYIYIMSGCRKPFDRLWISSMTDEAIQEGFRRMKPGSAYEGLFRSAQCRSQADWLVGMNASRAFSLRYGPLLSVGRVQTPTLAFLVKRRREIEQFKPEAYATVTADFGDYKGLYFHEKQEPDTHIPKLEDAKRIAEEIKGQQGVVRSAETTRKRDLPPQLYDLTSLQRDANRLLGFTADKTLKLAQSLYETRKALTYPRTDSRYLPPDMVPRVVQTMKLLPESYQALVPGALPEGKLPVSKRTVDETKVTDHHAIIPTAKRVDPATFPEEERQLYDLVARRLLAAFYPPCEYDATRVITQVGAHSFRTNGRVVLQNGWRDVPALENPPARRKKAKSADEEEEAALPPLFAGDTRTVRAAKVQEDKTKPPSPHNDASLLQAMEHAGREVEDEELQKQMKGSGIGTPATRAAIIERLVKVGYAQRKGKTILATDKGVQLIDVMPPEITSPEMTGRWELALDKITDGRQDPEKFMASIQRFTAFLVDYARTQAKPAAFPEERRGKSRSARGSSPKAAPARAQAKAIPITPIRGKLLSNDPRLPKQVSGRRLEGVQCPACGRGLLETEEAYACEGRPEGCYFVLRKEKLVSTGGPRLNEKILRLLLEHGSVRGSTGVLTLTKRRICFTPNGWDRPNHEASVFEAPDKPSSKAKKGEESP